MELKEICSTIACQYFKVGDVVECVHDHVRAHVGEEFTIQRITNKDPLGLFGYFYLKNKNGSVGDYWANCFKKVEK